MSISNFSNKLRKHLPLAREVLSHAVLLIYPRSYVSIKKSAQGARISGTSARRMVRRQFFSHHSHLACDLEGLGAGPLKIEKCI